MDKNKQLVQALDYSASIIVMTDKRGSIQYVNKTFEKKYGYKKEEVLGKNPRMLKTDFHPKSFYDEMWKTISSGRTWQGIFLNKTKNGNLLWENAIINPIISDSEEITGYIAIKEDVTDFKKTITELEASNKRYYSLVEDSPTMICRFNETGKLTYANSLYINAFLSGQNNISEFSFFDNVPAEQTEKIKNEIKKLTIDSPLYEFESIIEIEGKKRWFKNICRAICSSDNSITEFQIVSMDFTKLMETEEALIEHRNKLNAIINNSLIGIGVIDLNGHLKLVNEHFVSMMGYSSPEEMYNLHYDTYTHPDYIGITQKKIDELKTGEIDSFNVIKRYIKKDGTEFWGDLFVSPIKSESGKVTEIVGMVVDISVRIEMEIQMWENEKQLKELNRTKDKLFSIIAHDIKNPFNVILGFSRILNSNFESFSKKEILTYTSKIHDASENVYKLLEDLLIWAKTQMGQLKTNPDNVNLNRVVTDIYSNMLVVAKQKTIQLVSDLSDKDIVFADFEMVKFIFRNLIHNAIKFTPEYGLISINSEISDNYLRIFVKDTGIGIKKERLENLFDMNDITSTKGTNDETGTGLGLYLTKEMVLKNKGTIKVESATGKGTTFIIELPLAKR
ncbi:MAG: PAS domain S-box protein [Chlorobi bacterium]|nr:PAS domain S-box protein [Chlorobiota bacterium]